MKLPNLTPKEKNVEAYLVKEIHKLGGKAYKFVSPAHRSVPDRIILMPNGRLWFVEVKRSGGKLTPLQEQELDRLEAYGQKTFICYGRDGVDHFLRNVKNGRI